MPIRYYSEFDQQSTRPDARSTSLITVEISDDAYTGDPELLQLASAPAGLDFSNSGDNKEQVLTGSQASFQFVVTDTFSLDDLYTDQDMKWKVTVTRNGVSIWNGFIIPDGCSEAFVDPPFVVNVKAVDGLGILKNILYTSPGGAVLRGKRSVLQVIVDCLSKTGLKLPINTYCNLEYRNMVPNSDALVQTRIWAERFIEDIENDIPDNCFDVLESLLIGWGCKVVQRKGEWYVYNVLDVSIAGGLIDVYSYSPTGVFVEKKIVDLNVLLGNNEGDVIHCDFDQVKSNDWGFKKSTVKYEYGFLSNLVDIDTQKFRGLATGVFHGWNKNNGIDATPALFNNYARIKGTSSIVSENRSIDIDPNITGINRMTKMRVTLVFNSYTANGVPYVISVFNGTQLVRLTWDDKWGNDITNNYFNSFEQVSGGSNTVGLNKIVRVSREFTLPTGLPPTAYLNFQIFPAVYFASNTKATNDGVIDLYDFKISPIEEARGTISETHEAVNVANYTVNSDVLEVENGESKFQWYVGTMFQSDGETPTDGWRRKGETLYSNFLQITALDILKNHQRPMRKYEGSIYGYFDFFSIFTITHLVGTFMVLNAKYNLRTNKTQVTMVEIDHSEVEHTSSITYEDNEPDLGGIYNV